MSQILHDAELSLRDKRIAELEADAEVREEANQKLLSFGIKTGMERAAVIAATGDFHCNQQVVDAIRKEIDK